MEKIITELIDARNARCGVMIGSTTNVREMLLEIQDVSKYCDEKNFQEVLEIAIAEQAYKQYKDKLKEDKSKLLTIAWELYGDRPLKPFEVEYQSSCMYSDYGNKSMGYSSFNPFANTIAEDIDAAYKEKEESDKREKQIREIAVQAVLEGVSPSILRSFEKEYLTPEERMLFGRIHLSTYNRLYRRNK